MHIDKMYEVRTCAEDGERVKILYHIQHNNW